MQHKCCFPNVSKQTGSTPLGHHWLHDWKISYIVHYTYNNTDKIGINSITAEAVGKKALVWSAFKFKKLNQASYQWVHQLQLSSMALRSQYPRRALDMVAFNHVFHPVDYSFSIHKLGKEEMRLEFKSGTLQNESKITVSDYKIWYLPVQFDVTGRVSASKIQRFTQVTFIGNT